MKRLQIQYMMMKEAPHKANQEIGNACHMEKFYCHRTLMLIIVQDKVKSWYNVYESELLCICNLFHDKSNHNPTPVA